MIGGGPTPRSDRAKDFLTKAGLSLDSVAGAAGSKATMDLNGTKLEGFNAFAWAKALVDAGYPHYKLVTSDVAIDPSNPRMKARQG